MQSVLSGNETTLILYLTFVQPESVWLFDPLLLEEERSILRQLGCQLIPTNEVDQKLTTCLHTYTSDCYPLSFVQACKRAVAAPTLFFMPHCGRAMYNNLLWANWSPEKLAHTAIIGNSFSSYLERCVHSRAGDRHLLRSNCASCSSQAASETTRKRSTVYLPCILPLTHSCLCMQNCRVTSLTFFFRLSPTPQNEPSPGTSSQTPTRSQTLPSTPSPHTPSPHHCGSWPGRSPPLTPMTPR